MTHELEDDIRVAVEKEIDKFLKEPKEYENAFRNILTAQGIEPNLETVLSYLTGVLYGFADGLYLEKYRRPMTLEEGEELMSLLRRRAFEIRESIIGTRIE